jgi:hypothetical protein
MPDAAVEQTNQSGAKVFISYSRKDVRFGDQLDAALGMMAERMGAH